MEAVVEEASARIKRLKISAETRGSLDCLLEGRMEPIQAVMLFRPKS